MSSIDISKTVENICSPSILKNKISNYKKLEKNNYDTIKYKVEKLNKTVEEKINKVRNEFTQKTEESNQSLDPEKLRKKAKTIKKTSRALQTTAALFLSLRL
jgi:hypothetical protein